MTDPAEHAPAGGGAEIEPLTPETAVAELNGCEYGAEGSTDLWKRMRAARLVAVYGASDDLIEFSGAISDEASAYGGGTIPITPSGLLEPCEEECAHFRRARAEAATIKAVWAAPGQPDWTYETSIPHSTFDVLEDGKVYCRGIVFRLADAVQQ